MHSKYIQLGYYTSVTLILISLLILCVVLKIYESKGKCYQQIHSHFPAKVNIGKKFLLEWAPGHQDGVTVKTPVKKGQGTDKICSL